MIKAYEFIDIVIRRDSLEKKEKGLSQKFIEEYEVELPHYDEDIICVRGGMGPLDVQMTVENIEKDYGLIFNPNPKVEPITDIVIVDLFMGVYTRNSWLKAKIEDKNKFDSRQYYFEEENK